MSWDTVGPYHRGFREFTEAYEAFGFGDIHADVLAFLPQRPGLLLDVGAGSGRDAAWFAEQGWDVVAAEPAGGLRGEAARLHPAPRIRWVDDRLPALSAVHALGLSFDLVWLSGVWQHVHPDDRPRAMRKLATLLRPGGRMVVTLRHGPSPEVGRCGPSASTRWNAWAWTMASRSAWRQRRARIVKAVRT